MLTRFDDWLIDRVFARFAVWVRDRSGNDQFRLARESALLASFIAVLSAILITIDVPQPISPIFAIFVWWWLRPWEYMRILLAESLGGLWSRTHNIVARLVLLLLWLASAWNNKTIYDWLCMASMTFYLASYYFRAVELPPPVRKTELKEAYS